MFQTNIREMTELDLPRVMEIENASFVAKWKESDMLYELKENQVSNLFVIEVFDSSNSYVVGFSDYWNTFDSGTLCQIAIDPKYRGNGFASLLIQEILKDCYVKKVRNLTLEVRVSNQNAINLYHKHGFKDVIVKPHYYTNGEDAIYMMKEVDVNE